MRMSAGDLLEIGKFSSPSQPARCTWLEKSLGARPKSNTVVPPFCRRRSVVSARAQPPFPLLLAAAATAPSLLGRRRPTPNATPPPPHATASGANGAELNLCRNRTTGPGTLSLAMASQSAPPIGAPPTGAAALDGAVEDELATVQWRNESVALN